jgi:uncharacterized repeat protein (TIGR01451 family)
LHQRRSARYEEFTLRSFAASSLVLGLALSLPGIAFAKPAVTLKLTGSVVTVASDGHTMLTPVDKTEIKPGDRVRWDIVARNGGDSAAYKLSTVEKIQPGTMYVAGSAVVPKGHAEFSLDGGKTWSLAPTVTVKDAQGNPVVKKADPATYTAIRFVQDGALAAQATSDDIYEVRVK